MNNVRARCFASLPASVLIRDGISQVHKVRGSPYAPPAGAALYKATASGGILAAGPNTAMGVIQMAGCHPCPCCCRCRCGCILRPRARKWLSSSENAVAANQVFSSSMLVWIPRKVEITSRKQLFGRAFASVIVLTHAYMLMHVIVLGIEINVIDINIF